MSVAERLMLVTLGFSGGLNFACVLIAYFDWKKDQAL